MRCPRFLASIALLALLVLAAGCDRSTVPPASVELVAADTAQSRIAFVTGRDGNSEIYVMNADGTGVTRLTDNPASDQDPAWWPDSSRILFGSTRDGNSELYGMNADGSGVTRLSTDPAKDMRPAGCGDRIAFQSDRRLPPFTEIYVMNADGTGVTRLTTNNSYSESPVWSPFCDRIAYSYDPYGVSASIQTMNADGSNARQLPGPGKNRHPAWSPDGTRIAFTSDRDTPGNSFEIYVMNADGSQPTRLTFNSAFHFYDFPMWSPDGTQIAFQSYANAAPGIYVMNADGSGVTQVADNVSITQIAWFTAPAPPPPPPPPPVPPPPPPPPPVPPPPPPPPVPPPPPPPPPPVPPPPPPPPPPEELHIGDLDGSALRDGTGWIASVEITVHYPSHALVADSAIVTGVWSIGGQSSSCTTGESGASGTCTVWLPGLRRRVGTVSFTVTNVTTTGASYMAATNHDDDGTSDGTSITVTRQ